MAFKIEITKDTKINGKAVKKGDTLNVSRSIRDTKTEEGVAKDYKQKPAKKEDK
ncbi:MAG: hypothetical protein U9O83_01640 [Campylobacterota bacterium]|nr:hypothetical protein [Campylobacterota bacterium]